MSAWTSHYGHEDGIANVSVVLEGANPSAEGEDADDGGAEGGSERVLDIVDQFRLQSVPAPTKKMYQAHLKSMLSPIWT